MRLDEYEKVTQLKPMNAASETSGKDVPVPHFMVTLSPYQILLTTAAK